MKEHEEPIDADEVLRIARGVARRYAARCWWADIEDMTSEASIAILKARRTWDPEVGVPFAGYASRAATLRVRDYLWSQSSPVTGGLADPQKNIAGTQAVSLDEAKHGEVADPRSLLEEYEWRMRVRARVRKIAKRTKDGDLAIEVLVHDRPSGEVIKETGRRVYQAVHLVRRKARLDARLYRLWQHSR
jgi:DNA-directed RNA polymerase specialized sigma subunit